jgi:site-specific DNA recombinase
MTNSKALLFARVREKIANGQARKAESGQYPGHPPYGYTMEHKTIVRHPVNAEIVQHIYVRYGSGQTSLRHLRLELSRETGKRMSLASLRKILTNTFYIGVFVWCGRKYAGNHPRLVDIDSYEFVQRLLAKSAANQHRTSKRAES